MSTAHTSPISSNSVSNPGRVAGLWYLLLVLLGPLRLIYIPNKLFVHGDAGATANNIAAHQLLFRLGIVADLAGAVVLVLLGSLFIGCLPAWTGISRFRW